MAEKVFTPNDAVEIDAEFMENWLGGTKIESLSPKTLFDLQTLMAHYKDIIVPMDNVKVEFPTKGFDNACASVDEKKIFIPTQVLEDGLIDDTIGLVIHELNHIKHSEKETTLMKVCSNFLMVALDSIFVETDVKGDYVSLKEMVYREGFSFDNILSGEAKTGSEQFFGSCLKGVMLLLNAVEDVRIDATCPPNMKKYIDKVDERGFDTFEEHYKKGVLNEDNLMNLLYRLLYHHKGFITDTVIDTRFGDTDFIRNTEPKDYIPPLLKEFSNEIKQYCEEQYQKQGFEKPTQKPATDDYINMMNESSNQEGFEKMLGEDKNFSEECVRGVEFEDSELESRPNQESVYAKQVERRAIPSTVPEYLKASIDVFRNVDVINCSEQFETRYGTDTAEYKTLLIG